MSDTIRLEATYYPTGSNTTNEIFETINYTVWPSHGIKTVSSPSKANLEMIYARVYGSGQTRKAFASKRDILSTVDSKAAESSGTTADKSWRCATGKTASQTESPLNGTKTVR